MGNDLVNALKRFNCKERYWLIDNALGNQQLDNKFRKNLATSIKEATGDKFSIPCDAYWAIDFHINWLAAVFLLDKFDIETPTSFNEDQQKYFENNQKDVDLIIAFENTLICIEAKFIGKWDHKILQNKVDLIENILEERPKINAYYVCSSPEALPTDHTIKFQSKKIAYLYMTHNTDYEKNGFLYVTYDNKDKKKLHALALRPKLKGNTKDG